MRHFHTVVLERIKTQTQSFTTEPYETAWASEAMFFVRVHETGGKNAVLRSTVQVSVDGIDWIDEGTGFPAIEKAGTSFLRVTHFGGWLRLRNDIAGIEPTFKLTIHLVLKE